MIIVGICGGSGKSTFAERIRDGLSCSCEIMRLDCYYFDQGGKPFEERTKVNYDSPEIFDFDEMLADIRLLLDGKPVTRKGYNYAEHRRDDSEELMYPPEVLIIEGIHVFYDDRICDIMNLKLFIKVDSDICLLRRIARDMNERGRSLESISEQYKATVKPMREKYIDKYIDKADVVVMRGGMNEQALSLANSTISLTKDSMGVYDAALGNVKPNNTSAIIAVQQASAQPLELQRLDFYQAVEDLVRIALEFMGKFYGLREVLVLDEDGNEDFAWFDFGVLAGMNVRLKVNVGRSSYWSELVQVQTLDNMLAGGIIPDAYTYLEQIPEGYVRNKSRIMRALKKKMKENDKETQKLLAQLETGAEQKQ